MYVCYYACNSHALPIHSYITANDIFVLYQHLAIAILFYALI